MHSPILKSPRSVVCVLCMVFSLTISCKFNRKSQTIDGPEAKDLASKIRGYILMTEPGGGIIGKSFPQEKDIVIKKPCSPPYSCNPIHTISGPDLEGRVAYIEYKTEKPARHFLKIIKMTTDKSQTIFDRPGDALWDGVIGEHIALSPKGGWVAIIGELKNHQFREPSALLKTGPLEICDVKKRNCEKTAKSGLESYISWFPDGKRFAYVELVSRKELPNGFNGEDLLSGTEKWKKVPAVYIYDMGKKKSRFVHVGIRPIVSQDGHYLIVSGIYALRTSRLVDTRTGKSNELRLPGFLGRNIALFSKFALYWGYPTTGSKKRLTKSNSPLVGPKGMVTIKATELNTTNFQTLIPYIDPRRSVSFGQM